MEEDQQRVVVVGASPKPERYSNRAVRSLLEHGHEVLPVHPAASAIEGLSVFRNLTEIDGPVDAVTLYVAADRSSKLADDLIRLRPGSVIFNPGTENPALRAALEEQGIHAREACTLVLLKTGQF